MNILTFLFPFILAFASLCWLGAAVSYVFGKPSIPKRLDQIANSIAKGRVPKRFDTILRERVPGYREHYKLVPGRLACRAEPYYDRATKESVYALVIGFKEHVSKPADKYITIPVYKDGKLYE